MLQPCILAGEVVRLEPLRPTHVDQLAAVAFDEELWRWTTSRIATKADLEQYVAEALKAQEAGTALPFVTVECGTGRVIGSTRFANADGLHRRVEIGSTFVGRPWQRTKVNTEAKYLMLRYAFESLRCIRVEFKTDALNAKSRAAIKRLGATEEGILRSHMITEGGRIRDTVYFSVIESEWPRVSAGLLEKLSQ